MTVFGDRHAFAEALAALPMPDADAISAAAARQAELTKPAGSLGRLEGIAIFIAGWHGTPRPQITRARAAIFAGNHGVTVHGVSAFPPSVTAQMVANFQAGGAAINALSGAAGMDLTVTALDLDTPTADFTQAAAMSEAECLAALNAGAAVVSEDLDLLAVGEMGIGNSTAAAALCARSLVLRTCGSALVPASMSRAAPARWPRSHAPSPSTRRRRTPPSRPCAASAGARSPPSPARSCARVSSASPWCSTGSSAARPWPRSPPTTRASSIIASRATARPSPATAACSTSLASRRCCRSACGLAKAAPPPSPRA
jgi:hypothetical protein